MFHRDLLACGLLISLMACVPATSTLLPTLVHIPDTATTLVSAYPDPTASLPTAIIISPSVTAVSPTPQMPSTETPPPLPPLEPATLAATSIPQPTADSAAIQMLSPGPLSKIVSPLIVNGYAVPGYDDKGHLELYGEDGRLLASQLLQLNTPHKWALFYLELTFHSGSVGELGRLSLSTLDKYGRITAVNSVHLLLLSEGSSIVNPPGNLQERCVIEKPVVGQRVSGGILSVSGKMQPFNNLPLTAELISRDGQIIGTGLVPISTAPDGGYQSFRVDIPYRIPNASWVLLVVRQFDDRISGIMYLFSQEILLNP
jgi:hypothetical protein